MFYSGLCSISSRHLYLHITGCDGLCWGVQVVVLLAGSTFLFYRGGTFYLRYVRECGESAKSGTGMASGRSGKLSSSVNVIVDWVNDFCFNFIIYGSFNIFVGSKTPVHLSPYPLNTTTVNLS